MKLYITTLLLSFLIISMTQAQQIDHTFTYQGELSDGGMPANGLYNFQIEGFDAAGISKTNISEHLLVPVNNGLFTIDNVDLGVAGLDAYATFLQIRVKGLGVGSFIDLNPRQKLKAVPYAHKVIDGAATNGQVYTFSTTGGWGPADPVDLSPWTKDGQDIYFLSNTAVGLTNSDAVQFNGATHKLTVKSSDDKTLRLIGDLGTFGYNGKLNFGDDNFVYIQEDSDDHLKIYASAGVNIATDVKQPITANGMMKYMVQVDCGSPSSSIIKSFNGVSAGTISVANVANGSCLISFPDNISNRYFLTSPTFSTPGRASTCALSGTNDLICSRFSTSTATALSGSIMVLVY